MSGPTTGPDLGQRIQTAKTEARQGAEDARKTFRCLNTISPIPAIPVADNADPALATNWVTIFQCTTDTLNAGEYTGMIQAIWTLSRSNREAFFETFIDGVSLGPLVIPISDNKAESPNPIFFLPDLFVDFSVDKTHTIETKALINPGNSATMTISSIFALLSQTG